MHPPHAHPTHHTHTLHTTHTNHTHHTPHTIHTTHHTHTLHTTHHIHHTHTPHTAPYTPDAHPTHHTPHATHNILVEASISFFQFTYPPRLLFSPPCVQIANFSPPSFPKYSCLVPFSPTVFSPNINMFPPSPSIPQRQKELLCPALPLLLSRLMASAARGGRHCYCHLTDGETASRD